MFRYQSPIISFLVKVANMLIVSFYWLICCIPLVTIMPASAALYYTVNKAVFTNGAISKTFWSSFRDALKPGMVLSIECGILGVLLYLGFNTGLQIWRFSFWGAAYLALGVLFCLLYATVVIYLPPVLSKFRGNAATIWKLSIFFSGRKRLKSIWSLLLLALGYFAVDFFPLLFLLLPAVYTDLTRSGIEKEMERYISDNGLRMQENIRPAQVSYPEGTMGMLELDQMLNSEMKESENGMH